MAPKLNKKKTSFLKEALVPKPKVIEIEDNFKISFLHLDTTQKYGSGFKDWQRDGLLSKMMETLQGYCCSTLNAQKGSDKFTVYGNFPPAERTKFVCPSYIPEDVSWARIHITGAAIIAGYIFKDTFYVVFLDKRHKFWMGKRELSN